MRQLPLAADTGAAGFGAGLEAGLAIATAVGFAGTGVGMAMRLGGDMTTGLA